MRLESVNQKDDEFSSSKEWIKLKQELLGEVFGVHNPGFMVTDSYYFIGDVDLLSSGPITIHKMERGAFAVFKEKWSRTELDEIVAGGFHYCASLLWMLPNIDKMLSEKEMQEFWTIEDSIYEFKRACKPLNCNRILNMINNLEAIGCFCEGGNWILWTNPSSPEKLDSVVNNLKKLCLELQVELKE